MLSGNWGSAANLDENFTQRLNFCSLVQFCMKVWPYDWSRDGYQISHPEGRNIPTKSFSSGRKKKILHPIIRAWADKLAPLFFFCSPVSLLFSARNKTADLSHNSQIFGSIMLQGLGGKKTEEGNS